MFKSFIQWLLSLLGYQKKTEPTKTQIVASNAVAQTEVSQEETVNAEMSQASQARNAVDTQLLHGVNGSPDTVNTDPAAPVNASPDAHFRD